MLKLLRKLPACERGATAIEYGLIVSLIVLGMMTGLNALGGGTNSMWGSVSNKAQAAMR